MCREHDHHVMVHRIDLTLLVQVPLSYHFPDLFVEEAHQARLEVRPRGEEIH